VAKIGPFEAHYERYEQWFETHQAAYASELLALRPLVPLVGQGIEIGVGTGRFAGPLGVSVGLDPSDAMLARAAARGIETVKGTAEALPFPDQAFDYALVVTTICFVDSPEKMLPLVSFAAGSLVGGALSTRFRRRWSPCRSGRRSGGWRWDS
jgi:ubiquinone/menaquinone biosynthesis C-methylase UbiE